jgi:arginine-tRNA-protein transferase
MVEETHLETGVVEFRSLDGRLLGVILADWLDDGISAVYSFFDPQSPRRSLGTYMILALIDHALAGGRDYVYLGYWIAGSRKMSYKERFKPLQGLVNGRWTVLNPS